MISIEEQFAEMAKDLKDDIEIMESLERLKKNTDFKKVFHEQYMTYFAADIVRKKASPAMTSDRDQAYCDNQITAIGHLAQFFDATRATGEAAIDRLTGLDDEKHRILNPEEYGDPVGGFE